MLRTVVILRGPRRPKKNGGGGDRAPEERWKEAWWQRIQFVRRAAHHLRMRRILQMSNSFLSSLSYHSLLQAMEPSHRIPPSCSTDQEDQPFFYVAKPCVYFELLLFTLSTSLRANRVWTEYIAYDRLAPIWGLTTIQPLLTRHVPMHGQHPFAYRSTQS